MDEQLHVHNLSQCLRTACAKTLSRSDSGQSQTRGEALSFLTSSPSFTPLPYRDEFRLEKKSMLPQAGQASTCEKQDIGMGVDVIRTERETDQWNGDGDNDRVITEKEREKHVPSFSPWKAFAQGAKAVRTIEDNNATCLPLAWKDEVVDLIDDAIGQAKGPKGDKEKENCKMCIGASLSSACIHGQVCRTSTLTESG